MARLVTVIAVVVNAFVVVPQAFAATASLTFSVNVATLGPVPVGTTNVQSVTLTNTGSEPLTLSGYEAFGYNGDFSVDPQDCALGTTLTVGQSCTFSILTSPSIRGAIRGEFCFTGVAETAFDRECGRIVGGATPP
jgi:hypothetical protein